MKKRLTIAVVLFLLCLLAAAPALAADIFRYAQESVSIFDGESITPEIIREGRFAEGEVVYHVRGGHCTVDENGTVTAVAPASNAFSISSLIAAAGRSTTSPAAICPITSGDRRMIFCINSPCAPA